MWEVQIYILFIVHRNAIQKYYNRVITLQINHIIIAWQWPRKDLSNLFMIQRIGASFCIYETNLKLFLAAMKLFFVLWSSRPQCCPDHNLRSLNVADWEKRKHKTFRVCNNQEVIAIYFLVLASLFVYF